VLIFGSAILAKPSVSPLAVLECCSPLQLFREESVFRTKGVIGEIKSDVDRSSPRSFF
jgi:hypothetical protein